MTKTKDFYDTKLNENDKTAFKDKGIQYCIQGSYEKGIKCFTKAIEIDKEYALAFYDRGTVYLNQGRHQEALADFNKALEIDKDFTNALNNRGVLYTKQTRYQEALADFNKALEIDKDFTKALNNSGSIYFHFKEYEKAKKNFIKAIELDKEYKQPYLALIDLYKTLGDNEKANALYLKYQNLINDLQFHKYLEKRLDELKSIDLKKEFENLYKSVINIKSDIKYQGNDDLGHYTKIQNLKWLVRKTNTQSKSDEEKSFLRLNNIEYMNDPDEGNTFLKLLNRNIDCKTILDDIYNICPKNLGNRIEIKGEGNIFLSSLSKNIDNSLPMWRQYANDGDGCCLVFNSNFFKKDLELDDKKDNINLIDSIDIHENIKIDGLYNVIYVNTYDYLENENINKSITSICNSLKEIHRKKDEEISYDKVYKLIREILDNIRFLFKDGTYSYEEEIRLIKFEDIEDSTNENVKCTCEIEGFTIPRLYVNFEKDITPKEIILGPKVINEKGIANYIRYTGKSDRITKSKIRYQ